MASPTDMSALSSSEKRTLLAALLAQIAGLAARVEALEAENAALKAANAVLRAKLETPPKTPDNSSMPPSQGQKANAATKAKPKGKAHAGAHRPLHPNPTTRRDVFADRCPHCRAAVAAASQVPLQAYDRIEIPRITPDVTRVTLHGGTCPCCRGRFKAAPPAGLEPGSPFGPNLRAFVLYLRFGQAIPFARLERLLFDLFGLAISEGALANMLKDSAPAFEVQASAIRHRLLSGTVVQSDETAVRVGHRTFWTWVFHHGDSACFVIRPSRSKAVVAAFLGDVRPAFWVSDRLGAQLGWAAKEHQVCLAHLLRDIHYALDTGDDALAPRIMALLRQAIRIGQRRPDLADTTLATYHARLQSRLDALLTIVPATKAGQKLQRILKRFRQNLLVFVINRAVPPTNNGSEQALRPCVVFRKVTNCFRSAWGAALYANVRSVLETARRRGIAILNAIRLTLDGTPLSHRRRLTRASSSLAAPVPASWYTRAPSEVTEGSSMAKAGRQAESIVRLKVTLRGIRPPIWRRLLVPDRMTLGDLHHVIQAAMGWDDAHLHVFDIAGQPYSDPHDVDDVADEERLTVNGVLRSGVSGFTYTYDFGDDWEHATVIEGKQPPVDGRSYPACVAGKRSCPPEDCGGCWGYQELLAILADPAHPRRQEWVEMIGEGFDPEAFSAEAADARVAARFGRR